MVAGQIYTTHHPSSMCTACRHGIELAYCLHLTLLGFTVLPNLLTKWFPMTWHLATEGARNRLILTHFFFTTVSLSVTENMEWSSSYPSAATDTPSPLLLPSLSAVKTIDTLALLISLKKETPNWRITIFTGAATFTQLVERWAAVNCDNDQSVVPQDYEIHSTSFVWEMHVHFLCKIWRKKRSK